MIDGDPVGDELPLNVDETIIELVEDNELPVPVKVAVVLEEELLLVKEALGSDEVTVLVLVAVLLLVSELELAVG